MTNPTPSTARTIPFDPEATAVLHEADALIAEGNHPEDVYVHLFVTHGDEIANVVWDVLQP